MATPAASRPRSILVRDLVLALAVAIFAVVVLEVLERWKVPGQYVLLYEAGAILLVAWLVARALTGSATALLARRGDVAQGATLRIFINLVIAVAAVLALFSLAGVSIESIFLGSALAGIVLGLAAQTVLANVFAGLLLIASGPFRPGDRINIVSGSLGAIAPSYPHELLYPLYGGIVEDIGLVYTVLRQDSGGVIKVPNSVVLSGVVQHPESGIRTVRIRMTFPQTVAVATVESAIIDLRTALQGSRDATTRFSFEVIDISAATWDGLVLAVTATMSEATLRDRVLRAVLSRLTAGPGPGRPAGPTA